MSIDPVTTINSAAAGACGTAPVREREASPGPPSTKHSSSEPNPVPEIHLRNLTSQSSEMPQDEVQVQRTEGGSGDIVIRYMDPHGNLILQIPSSQVLGVARAIERALDEQASREMNGSGNSVSRPGGTSHGY